MLSKEGVSFSDLELESAVVDEESTDVLHGEVDEHASDLGGSLLTSHGLNEFVDELTHLSLEVRVVRNDGWGKVSSLLVVSDNVRW